MKSVPESPIIMYLKVTNTIRSSFIIGSFYFIIKNRYKKKEQNLNKNPKRIMQNVSLKILPICD